MPDVDTTGVETPPNETPNETPTIDRDSPEFQAAVEEAAKEAREFHERAKAEYEDARGELIEWRKQQQTAQTQRPQQSRPDGDVSIQDFYKNIQQELIDAGVPQEQAKADVQSRIREKYELVKFWREALANERDEILKEVRGVASEFSEYREGRAFQDIEFKNATIGGVPFRSMPETVRREIMADAEKIRSREFPDLPAAAAMELALGRRGGKKYVETVEEETKRSEAATGLPASGAGLTTDRVRRALNGRSIRSMSLGEIQKEYEALMQ